MSRHRIVAAIDFGTHGTGFAWAFASEAGKEPGKRTVHFYDEWDGQPTSYIKNLTALLTNPDHEVLAWGYEAQQRFLHESRTRPDLAFFHRFKMHLLAGGAPSGPGTELELAGRKVEQLVTAYLKVLYEFAVGRILAATGVREEEIRWCLTVPAIWRDRERRVMRDCAVAAGLPADPRRLLIAVEPEVAALYCQHDAGVVGMGHTNERFMVVDAGGGTVDITAYKVDGEGLTEIGYTSGGSHGATYVDQYFLENVVASRVGSDTIKRVVDLEPSAFVELLNAWERVKREFSPERQRLITVPLTFRLHRLLGDDALRRLAEAQNGVDDAVTLMPAEAAQLFELAVGPILSLVDDQLSKIGQGSVDRILLVGGFAQSEYLRTRLADHVGKRAKVLVPSRPASAVLIGAVHYALQPEAILGRRSRYTYGFSVALDFEQGDPPGSKVVDTNGREKCTERFDICVRANDIVEPGHQVTKRYYPIYSSQESMTIAIYQATAAEPRYVTEQSCKYMAEVVVDMKSTVSMPAGQRSVDVTMLFGGTEIDVRAVDTRTGVEAKASIEFSPEDD
ncbi:Hsp70 family protein [Longispora albida]|uniref:Hsp70 family protein n=1 Tax=Longispora albida TaxID=203523 RepID=UPI000382CC33|nr:Hsp70 family protein [Longispora albida]